MDKLIDFLLRLRMAWEVVTDRGIPDMDFDVIKHDIDDSQLEPRNVYPARIVKLAEKPDDSIPEQDRMKLIHKVLTPYGPGEFFICGASLIARIPSHGWMFYGSAPPPPKEHPSYMEDEDGRPFWFTGTFLSRNAEVWIEICKQKGSVYADKAEVAHVGRFQHSQPLN